MKPKASRLRMLKCVVPHCWLKFNHKKIPNRTQQLHFSTSNYDSCPSSLTIAAIKTLRPKASEISVKSPLDCVQAAQEKKLRMKMPMNSARIDFHRLCDLALSSVVPNVYLDPIVARTKTGKHKIIGKSSKKLVFDVYFRVSSCRIRKCIWSESYKGNAGNELRLQSKLAKQTARIPTSES